ncbi:MAG: hypothetical protein ACXVYB_00130 [Arthrobacter sp.]
MARKIYIRLESGTMYEIDAGTCQVGEQNVWKGDPVRLLGFEGGDGTKVYDNEFVAQPTRAVGLHPVFDREDGSEYVHPYPVTSIEENRVPEQ